MVRLMKGIAGAALLSVPVLLLFGALFAKYGLVLGAITIAVVAGLTLSVVWGICLLTDAFL